MKALLVLSVAFVGCAVPTVLVWLLGRRVQMPASLLTVFLLAGWLTVSAGWFLSHRAQLVLFPETSPCRGISGPPAVQYFPPDSFCRHTDGELRTVNGAHARILFWTAAAITVAMPLAAAYVGRRQKA
ncbi:hypothetical protein ACWGRF_09800 [Streptomyces zhihengii]|uniref:hypothetical protein n=1 Tax=Streptomyces zhihengii TaxID=1818004 RepID=UPI0034551527